MSGLLFDFAKPYFHFINLVVRVMLFFQRKELFEEKIMEKLITDFISRFPPRQMEFFLQVLFSQDSLRACRIIISNINMPFLLDKPLSGCCLLIASVCCLLRLPAACIRMAGLLLGFFTLVLTYLCIPMLVINLALLILLSGFFLAGIFLLYSYAFSPNQLNFTLYVLYICVASRGDDPVKTLMNLALLINFVLSFWYSPTSVPLLLLLLGRLLYELPYYSLKSDLNSLYDDYEIFVPNSIPMKEYLIREVESEETETGRKWEVNERLSIADHKLNISCIGNQRTGKSTLLNHLSGCSFQTAQPGQRRCTTGIDVGFSQFGNVFDVEGINSPERALQLTHLENAELLCEIEETNLLFITTFISNFVIFIVYPRLGRSEMHSISTYFKLISNLPSWIRPPHIIYVVRDEEPTDLENFSIRLFDSLAHYGIQSETLSIAKRYSSFYNVTAHPECDREYYARQIFGLKLMINYLHHETYGSSTFNIAKRMKSLFWLVKTGIHNSNLITRVLLRNTHEKSYTYLTDAAKLAAIDHYYSGISNPLTSDLFSLSISEHNSRLLSAFKVYDRIIKAGTYGCEESTNLALLSWDLIRTSLKSDRELYFLNCPALCQICQRGTSCCLNNRSSGTIHGLRAHCCALCYTGDNIMIKIENERKKIYMLEVRRNCSIIEIQDLFQSRFYDLSPSSYFRFNDMWLCPSQTLSHYQIYHGSTIYLKSASRSSSCVLL